AEKAVAGGGVLWEEGAAEQVEQFGKVVQGETVACGEAAVVEFGHFPTGNEAVDALEEGGVHKLLGQGLEEMVVFFVRKAAHDVEVADEADGGFAFHLEPADREIAVFEV